LIALLPYDPSQLGSTTSPYVEEEIRLAMNVGKPLLILAEPGVEVEKDLLQASFRGKAVILGPGADTRAALTNVLDDFNEVLGHVAHDDTGAFIFLAASLLGAPSETDNIASVIERSSNMRCVRGERLSGDNVQKEITDRIQRAAVMIADVSDDHRNTLIETGIAMGSGTRLRLMCRAPPSGAPPKKAFMFEGLELCWYHTPEEQLGLYYYFAHQFRRRIYVFR
jgi:hypothetical protein